MDDLLVHYNSNKYYEVLTCSSPFCSKYFRLDWNRWFRHRDPDDSGSIADRQHATASQQPVDKTCRIFWDHIQHRQPPRRLPAELVASVVVPTWVSYGDHLKYLSLFVIQWAADAGGPGTDGYDAAAAGSDYGDDGGDDGDDGG